MWIISCRSLCSLRLKNDYYMVLLNKRNYTAVVDRRNKAQILTGSQNTRKSSNSRTSANDIAASNPPRQNQLFVVRFLIPSHPSQKLKWILKFCSYLKCFLINRLQRYSSRVVYMFRLISYLEPELRVSTGREKLTFLPKFI